MFSFTCRRYDTVNHQFLLCKLKRFGVRDVVLEMYELERILQISQIYI